MTVTINVDLTGLNQLVTEIGQGVEHAIRPTAQAGAQVLYDEVKANVGRLGKKTGNLAAAIYQAFDTRASNAQLAAYRVSWNTRKAPHAGLVEFGYLQRYAVYVGKDGLFHTAVRADAKGKKKPGRRAGQAEKDAYYQMRKGGPAQIPAKPFMRPVAAKLDLAAKAVETEFFKRINAL